MAIGNAEGDRRQCYSRKDQRIPLEHPQIRPGRTRVNHISDLERAPSELVFAVTDTVSYENQIPDLWLFKNFVIPVQTSKVVLLFSS